MTIETTAAVVVAHPGHEVRIHGWLERERPTVFVLTDGSGREGVSRIDATREYLKRFGMRTGPCFGRFTDMEVYRLMLARDFRPFIELCEELAATFVEERVGRVAGDASEGYNTTHDIARLVTNAAVELARRDASWPIANYDFTVVHRPDHCPARLRARAVWVELDDEAFARKLDAAFEFYPALAAEVRSALGGDGDDLAAEYFKLKGDADAATDYKGLDVFRAECLRPVTRGDPPFETPKPFYERWGETKVAAGFYEQVIRYREHMLPLAAALAEAAGRSV
jgi:hypothetical protein